jgi:hypothetical protein
VASPARRHTVLPAAGSQSRLIIDPGRPWVSVGEFRHLTPHGWFDGLSASILSSRQLKALLLSMYTGVVRP